MSNGKPTTITARQIAEDLRAWLAARAAKGNVVSVAETDAAFLVTANREEILAGSLRHKDAAGGS